MSGLFIEILNMSLSAGCVAIVVMLIRLLIKKAPKKYAYVLWAVVFFRLVCPFTIQLPISAVPIQPQTIPYDIVYSESPSVQSGIPVVDNVVNSAIERTLPPANSTSSANPIQIALEIGAYIWIAGILVLLLYGITSYLRLKKRVGTAIRVHNNIYETDQIKTPFVLGFIRPKIYIPTEIGEKELEYVIAHERTHIKRFDYLIKPFAFLVTSVHWFNPLAWVSYALMARDMELSADESVMKYSALDIRSDYSSSLLALSVKKGGLLSPLAFGETGVKIRIKNVLNYKKPAFGVSIVTIIVVFAMSFLLMGSRASSESNKSTGNEDIPQAGPVYSTDYYYSEGYGVDFNQTISGLNPDGKDIPQAGPVYSTDYKYYSEGYEVDFNQSISGLNPEDEDVRQVGPVYSSDNKYYIEGYGAHFDQSSSGLDPLYEIRIVEVSSDQTVWSMDGSYFLYQMPQFCWSPDDRYVSIVYAGRIWVNALLVDTQDMSEHPLPGLSELAPYFPDAVQEENRPDPSIVPQYWTSNHTILVSFSWFAPDWVKREDGRVRGEYIYDVDTGELTIMSSEPAPASDIPLNK